MQMTLPVLPPLVSCAQRARQVRPHFAVALALCLLSASSLYAAPALTQSGSDGAFSAKELGQLKAGELVTRASSEERGSLQLIGGTSWQVIHAAPAVVFQALLDTQRYPHMLPAVTGARL